MPRDRARSAERRLPLTGDAHGLVVARPGGRGRAEDHEAVAVARCVGGRRDVDPSTLYYNQTDSDVAARLFLRILGQNDNDAHLDGGVVEAAPRAEDTTRTRRFKRPREEHSKEEHRAPERGTVPRDGRARERESRA